MVPCPSAQMLHASYDTKFTMKKVPALSSDTKPVLQDLDPLSTLPKLQHLSLLDNPVTKQPNYRCDLTCVHTGTNKGRALAALSMVLEY